MENNTKSKLDQQIALFRYELIIPVLNNTYPDHSALQYYKRIASTSLPYVDGTKKDYSYQTIRYWYDLYRQHGFDALYPKIRSDHGHSRKLTKTLKDKILTLKMANHRLTATSIYLKLIEDGDLLKKDISLSTLTRYVASIKPAIAVNFTEDMRAFEMEHTNELWQLDTTYCPYINMDGKKRRTYLIMIIDDHSRLLVGYGFFFEDNAFNVQLVLKRAIHKYGIPKRLYTDNGSPYKNEQLSLICGQLQIQISRAQPYHGNQKGKIERAFKSVKEQWMYNQDFSQFQSAEEIEACFSEYVTRKNSTVHASLNGQTPLQVFMGEANRIRRMEKEIIEKAFYYTVLRKVANDATIHLNTRIFETAQHYIGQKIIIKYIPDLSKVYIFKEDRYIEIKEVNKIDNAKIKRNTPLFAEVLK